jgi:hypothetical protein
MGKDGKFGLASNKPVGVVHGYVEMSEQDLDESGYLKDPKMEDRIIKMTTEDVKGNPKVVYRIPTQVHFDLYDQSKQVKFNSYIGMTNKQITELNPLQQKQSQPQRTRKIDYLSDGTMWDSETKEYLGRY